MDAATTKQPIENREQVRTSRVQCKAMTYKVQCDKTILVYQ
jgi:hypothetical protein